MLPIVPKEIADKIRFENRDVYVEDGIKLTKKEQEVFDKFREHLKQANIDRFS